MKCPQCKQNTLKVTNTYHIDDAYKTQRAICPCGCVATIIVHTEITTQASAYEVSKRSKLSFEGQNDKLTVPISSDTKIG